ncbi:MAG: metallophosphoesterase [Oscillospiraceae bacterium]|jgi:UDP-2,3-diacylglucosamine pyrophosphatase LpxH|nr:metallophosphoesterase [Oscillospiraceae bacterium]
MSQSSHIDRAYRNAAIIEFDSYSRIVLMSDCHRGYGNWADNFAVNEDTYFAALREYNRQSYTYIELGDGDELWENRKFSEISAVHNHIFWLLQQMWDEKRFYMLYGNHDIEKRRNPHLMDRYYDATERLSKPLFPDMRVYESLILRQRSTGDELFLLHGHQADFFNDRMWRLARFLCRHFWKPLQMIGAKAPASPSSVGTKMDEVEERLSRWAEREDKIVIAGHTHRARFPQPGEPKYFNDGSCVHPRCITAIEITGGVLRLVKWSHKTRTDGTLYVGRDVLAGPVAISAYTPVAQSNGAMSISR